MTWRVGELGGSVSPRRSPYDGDLTREALVDAAERLFADEGLEAVSVRSINKAAGVAPAAVHYHFGSKDALLDAVLARRGPRVLSRIVERADVLLARRRRPTAREIVECLAVPYRDLLVDDPVGGARWLRVVAQLSLAQDERMAALGKPAETRLRDLTHRAYPHADEVAVATRLPLAITALIQMMGRARGEVDAAARDRFEQALIDFVAGGLDAAMKAAGGGRTQARPA
jgi:AcrR family transcriptional regulator